MATQRPDAQSYEPPGIEDRTPVDLPLIGVSVLGFVWGRSTPEGES
jgi:hypothetical protein